MKTNDNLGDNYKDMKLHEKIREAREKQGLSQAAAGKLVGISQPAVKKIESGETVRSRYIDELARKLGVVDHTELGSIAIELDEDADPQALARARPAPEFFGRRDFKVFSSVECGSGEMTVFQTDPYEIAARPWFVEGDKEAFGVVCTGDSMEPVYEAGDVVIISPRAPLIKGKDAVFSGENVGGDFRASLKRYRGQTADAWLAKQFNPPDGSPHDIELDRTLWQNAWRVLGALKR